MFSPILSMCGFAYQSCSPQSDSWRENAWHEETIFSADFLILLVPLIQLGQGREGVIFGISVNILIVNDKHSGACSPTGEIKELELCETSSIDWNLTAPPHTHTLGLAN